MTKHEMSPGDRIGMVADRLRMQGEALHHTSDPGSEARKEFRRMVSRSLERLERDDGPPTFDRMLEAWSWGVGFKDWNTMSAALGAATPACGQPRAAGAASVSPGQEPACRTEAQYDWSLAGLAALKDGTASRDAFGFVAGEPIRCLVSGPSGSGKSTLASALAISFCMRHARSSNLRNPAVSIVESLFGNSSVPARISELLPEAGRRVVSAVRLKRDSDHAINMLDLPLGFRNPAGHRRASIINTVMSANNERGNFRPTDHGWNQLVAAAVDRAYEHRSDETWDGQPKPYVPGVEASVDAALLRFDITPDADETWWGCVDKLFDAGALDAAADAQRNAVPLLEDLLVGSQEEEEPDFPNGSFRTETLAGRFRSAICSVIRNHPFLNMPTRLPTDHAYVTSVVIDETVLAKTTNFPMFYLLARQVALEPLYPVLPSIRSMEPTLRDGYLEHHARADQALERRPRLVVFQDFPGVSDSHAVRGQIALDMREARLRGVSMIALNGDAREFGKEAIREASDIWFAGGGIQDRDTEMSGLFGLAHPVWLDLLAGTAPPSDDGARLVRIRNGIGRRTAAPASFKLAAEELWALTDRPFDMALRICLEVRLGCQEARMRLAEHFPSGSACDEHASRLLSRDRDSVGIVKDIADELEAAPRPRR